MTETHPSTVVPCPKRTIPRARRNPICPDMSLACATVRVIQAVDRLRRDPVVLVPMRRSVCVAHNIEFLS